MKIPRSSAAVLAAFLAACGACKREALRPQLPEGSAGEILASAIEAAGGWERWIGFDDVAYVATLMFYDPIGNVTSESIGLHKSPLHAPPRVRFESLSLPEPVTLGFDGSVAWMLRDGKAPAEPPRLELARFNMVSEVFWFSLPFNLAELPVAVTDIGEEEDDEGRWRRLRVTLEEGAPEAPGDWFVISFDARTHLIGKIFGHITAEFLTHNFWVGKWLDYRDWNGIRKERRRRFFPADEQGKIVGRIVVERLVEDVRFNNGFSDETFRRPLAADGGSET